VNGAVNHSVPTSAQLQGYNTGSWTGYADPALAIHARVTGNFTGTTDELIQWAACKWGFDEDVVRAQAQTESNWYQRGGVAGQGLGDYTRDMSLCPPGTWDGQGCFQSYGLLQAKYIYSQSAWPMIRDDTAFNLDFVYGWRRACFEGHITWLHQAGTPGYPDYAAGDLWGCVGQWFSGGWYDGGAIAYIGTVQKHLADKDWLKPGF